MWIFLFVVWFWLLITIFTDLFGDHEMSGWGKAAWILAVIVFSWIGVLVYLIVRGKGMAERDCGATAVPAGVQRIHQVPGGRTERHRADRPGQGTP
ncbi:MAG: PLD nuclease N-terminal domain-containing protein [Microthrixaceae bacterium]